MANIGNDWSKATITYRNDVSLDVEMSFEYEKGSQSSHFEIKDLPDSDSELSDIVKLFIKDYEDWNAFAYERRNISKNTREDISYQSYKQLIQKYCHKDKKFQGLSYGGESSHSQYNEKINCVIQSDDYGIVNTSNAKGDEYEYHFFINGGRWVLDEVYYIDFCSGRKYESL
jgi:hypothetical protein